MEESNEEVNVVPELYFLIAKFLSNGPLKETAKTLLKELESVEVLPRRLDWEGNEHPQSYDELESQYSEMSSRRLAAVCQRALQLARATPPAPAAAPGEAVPDAPPAAQQRLAARLSLLSETLVRPRPKYSAFNPDHTLVRRLVSRELGGGGGGGCAARAGGGVAGGAGPFPARLLRSLQLQRRTLGHLSAVYCLVFDCTGRYVVTGADDLLVKVWSAVSGRLLRTLRGAGAEITDVCASHDGALLACGSVERLVRVWCLASGAPRAVLHAHQGTITSVHWAPPAHAHLGLRWLASTSTDGSVAFWAGSSEGQFAAPVQFVERLRPGACHMICAAWSAGAAFLAAGSADHYVRLYAMQPGGPRRVLETAVHCDAVDSIAWAHRGLRLLSGSKDGTAALWALHATQWRHTLLRAAADDHKKLKVTMVCWDCTDEFVMTAVSDNTIRVWCSRTCTQTRVLRGHRDEAYVLEAHPFLRAVLLSAGHDGQLFVWDAAQGEVISRYHNEIAGQGEGALFDAKWGGGALVAASDSHGHLLLLAPGCGHRLLRHLPTELFFHTDYRPLVRDALGGALDEQTETPPHLMPPPFLVDVEGAPHGPAFQRLVPGREHLALAQLIPAHSAAATAAARLDAIIEAMAAEVDGFLAGGVGIGAAGGAGGVWRGEGVRHTGGSWERAGPLDLPPAAQPAVPPLPRSVRERIEQTSAEMHAFEMAWYRREMRRRPVMISTAAEGVAGPRRRGGRPRARPRPAPPPARVRVERLDEEPPEEPDASSDTSDESVRLSASSLTGTPSGSPSSRSGRSSPSRTRPGRAVRVARRVRARPRPSSGSASGSGTGSASDSDSSRSASKSSHSDDSSASSQYSDWEAGSALAPPARARRKPVPTTRATLLLARRCAPVRPDPVAAVPAPAPGARGATPPARYSPSAAAVAKRPAAAAAAAAGGAGPSTSAGASATVELPEAYRVGEWLTAVAPRKAPYHPQMGDHCLYFRLGHQRYLEAVAEKDLYKVHPRDRPWERMHIYECEAVQVVGMKYCIKPPRVACVRLARERPPAGARRCFTVRYHDMPDVIDFLVLRAQYTAAVQRRWGAGDRFRCMIDDSWWTGTVLERLPPAPPAAAPSAPLSADAGAAAWAADAAANFLALRVRWDNGEVERLSPWDLEPIDPDRLPQEPGGAVPVLPHELEAVLYRSETHEWPAAACRHIAHHISQVMSLSVAEPFVAPVDLQAYPSYALVVPYPVDLATVRARFENLFYRRAAAAQFDARFIASNAERFNEPHSPIVRQARLVTDLLLAIIARWRTVDVLATYHDLAAAYQSEEDTPQRSAAGSGGGGRSAAGGEWRSACAEVLRELLASADAEPFRRPVSPRQAPDYSVVVPRPMDLGTVSARLAAGRYARAAEVAADVRLVFANSRLYNTNKRSRIYSMTVRLSSLFEALWARVPATRGRRPRRAVRPRASASLVVHGGTVAEVGALGNGGVGLGVGNVGERSSGSSDSETLAATSRRVHAATHSARENARGARADSWDSDAPLNAHRKGKGIGKKSKSGPAGARTAACSASTADGRGEAEGESASSSEWERPAADTDTSAYSRIEVVEEELPEDEVELTYEEARRRRHCPRHRPRPVQRARAARKRRRARSSDVSSAGVAPVRPKRVRERFSEGSWSSSSSGAGGEAGGDAGAAGARYESDRSYRPNGPYSTDDDAPLLLYRQRQEGSEEAGPSGRSHSNSNSRGEGGGGVSLRTRNPRRYNEDSEEDSIAAISKRLPHHHHHHLQQRQLASRRRRHLAGAGASGARRERAAGAHTADHNYYNGHAPPDAHAHHNGGGGQGEVGGGGGGGGASGSGSGSGAAGPVSISSRGRVRRLTAKARGLLRD